ncbi:hypothetical protein ILUMI_23674 [Ignelater luminosus]|uniref:Uncharacterized protein n=1 Tax=Ignelater luminosus TaxID=2038154 RepID=A0A8K0CAI1_IGNLU|nr:hypothetical protein ILUMI_23674 [Ignelater luminosus]
MKMIVWNLVLFFIFQVIAAELQEPLKTLASLPLIRPTVNGGPQVPSILYGITGGDNLQPIFSTSEMQYKPLPIFPRHVQKMPDPKEQIPYPPKPNNVQFVNNKAKVITEQAKDQAVDLLIKNRIGALQNLQINLNKLFEDIGNIASTFVTKHSFFGGVTRRSLFDPSILDDIKVISADLVNIGSDLNRIARNSFDDFDTFIHYMSDHRNFDFRNLFSSAFTTALRLFTY